MTSFSSLGLCESLQNAVDQLGYKKPTPIQAKAIPMILTGRDVMASSQTGTGKTASFTLPLLHRLSEMRPSKHLRALILVPTRELALQITESLKAYGQYTELRINAVFGGIPIEPQIEALQQGVDILVATPGRLLDLINQKHLSVQHLRILVLDEADRMLDLGFRDDMTRLMSLMPEKRQNLLFSATFSRDIKQLAHDFMRHPVKINTEQTNLSAKNVKQSIYPVEQQDKPEILSYLIQSGNWEQTLVFVRTKKAANKVADLLIEEGIEARAIHSDKSQYLRARTLEDFKDKYFSVLVATDVAARGLDIEQLPLVINYDLPKVAQDYVHRIGRTGRAGLSGRAISLMNPEEKKQLADIRRLTKLNLAVEPVPYFEAGKEQSFSNAEGTKKQPATPIKRKTKAPRSKHVSKSTAPYGSKGKGRSAPLNQRSSRDNVSRSSKKPRSR